MRNEDIWGGLGDIWVAALGQEVRTSGLEVAGMGLGVWVAVSGREVRTRSRGCARIYARPLAVGIWEATGALSRSTIFLSKI